jgi:hypothetical protein
MADNTAQNGTDTIATDDLSTLNGGAVSGVKVQRVKVQYGSDSDARDVDATHGLPVTAIPNTSATGAASAPTITAASTAALASNASRKGAAFYNDANVDVLLALGFTASVTAYTVRLLVGGYYEVPALFTGAVNMLGVAANTTTATASTTGGIRVTEFT